LNVIGAHRINLTHLSLDMWPLSLEDGSISEFLLLEGPEEEAEEQEREGGRWWCPSLRHLEVAYSEDDSKWMEALATLLKYRQDAGEKLKLESLVVHKLQESLPFPYDLFENLDLARFDVMVPF
jgi:hypothetical protein